MNKPKSVHTPWQLWAQSYQSKVPTFLRGDPEYVDKYSYVAWEECKKRCLLAIEKHEFDHDKHLGAGGRIKMITHIAQQDPWQSYESQSNGKGKGPKVPEPATYGSISIFLMIAIVMWFRRKK